MTRDLKPSMFLRAALLFLAGLIVLGAGPLFAQEKEKEKKNGEKQESTEKAEKASDKDDGTETRLRIEVVAGEKDEAVDNASVYVKFMRERTLRKDEKIEMNTKTNRSGVAILGGVPRGKVLVQVVAQGWKTFGQWYELDKSEQTIKIKLVKPPRWY